MSLKNDAIRGVFWSSVEKFSMIIVQFFLQIVLARLLTPKDYGIVGILAVFIAVATTFIDCGFTKALIQNQQRTEKDYSTAFYFNLAISLACYILLFISAPYIADFYNLPILEPVTRILTLTLPISAISAVNRTKLQIKVDFKTQSKITVSSYILSGIIGVILAYNGFGVWALVTQIVLGSIFNTILLFWFVKWFPKENFSIESFKKMYNFGIKILGSSLIDTFYYNMYPLIIGKFFSPADLGFFSKGKSFAHIPNTIINGVLDRVTFPIFSRVQNDLQQLFHIYRKYLRLMSSVYVPIILVMCALAKPLIVFLLGEKWLGCVPVMQIFCISVAFDCMINVNLNFLYVKGYTDIVLKLTIIKKIIAFIILITFFKFGGTVIWLCWGQVLYTQIAVFLITYYTKKLLGLSYFLQMKDVFPIYVVAAISAVTAYAINFIDISNIMRLITAVPLSAIIYLLLAYILKFEIIDETKILLYKLKNKYFPITKAEEN